MTGIIPTGFQRDSNGIPTEFQRDSNAQVPGAGRPPAARGARGARAQPDGRAHTRAHAHAAVPADEPFRRRHMKISSSRRECNTMIGNNIQEHHLLVFGYLQGMGVHRCMPMHARMLVSSTAASSWLLASNIAATRTVDIQTPFSPKRLQPHAIN